ncbi:zinc finger domain-containing protein [Microcoleus sp. ARI1-A5]
MPSGEKCLVCGRYIQPLGTLQ